MAATISDLVVVIELILPGYVSFILFRQLGEWDLTISDTQIVYVSLLLSFVDLVPTALYEGIAGFSQIGDTSLTPTFVAPLFLTAIAVGVLLGLLSKSPFLTKRISRSYAGTAWRKFITPYVGFYVHLLTQGGKEYYGYVKDATVGDDEPREISIRDVEVLVRDKDGAIASRREFADNLFVPSSEVESIWRDSSPSSNPNSGKEVQPIVEAATVPSTTVTEEEKPNEGVRFGQQALVAAGFFGAVAVAALALVLQQPSRFEIQVLSTPKHVYFDGLIGLLAFGSLACIFGAWGLSYVASGLTKRDSSLDKFSGYMLGLGLGAVMFSIPFLIIPSSHIVGVIILIVFFVGLASFLKRFKASFIPPGKPKA